jgi:hypothetical protein
MFHLKIIFFACLIYLIKLNNASDSSEELISEHPTVGQCNYQKNIYYNGLSLKKFRTRRLEYCCYSCQINSKKKTIT